MSPLSDLSASAASLLESRNKNFTKEAIQEYESVRLEEEMSLDTYTLKKLWGENGYIISGIEGQDIFVVEIPATYGKTRVVEIGKRAFRNKRDIREITLSEGILEIGPCAFDGCGQLKEINLNEGITKIGYSAFRNCRALEKIEIPKTTELLDNGVFEGCEALVEIEIPEGIKEIRGNTFESCKSLARVDLPTSLWSIGARAFKDCTSLKEIYIPLGVERVNKDAFLNCKDLTIYCEAEEKGKYWHEEWNPDNLPVVWNHK